MKMLNGKKLFIPVVHVEDCIQAIIQVDRVMSCGADGVFLINHSVRFYKLFEIYEKIRQMFPKLWIGLNCLELYPSNIMKIVPKDVNGVWVDNAYINEMENSKNQLYPSFVTDIIEERNWKGSYFGGVAFKYQKKVKKFAKVTELASKFMDVITTSGAGTGIAPDVKKIKIMSKVAHENGKRLAIASGITPDNVHLYKDADIFMVSTGISKSFTEFDPVLVRELSEKIKLL